MVNTIAVRAPMPSRIMNATERRLNKVSLWCEVLAAGSRASDVLSLVIALPSLLDSRSGSGLASHPLVYWFYLAVTETSAMTAADVTEQLTRFEHLCRGRGALNVERMRPGVSPERIRELEAAHGVRLPSDAKAVWLWHDGLDDQDQKPTVRFWGHAYYFQDLESSLRDARMRLDSRNSGDVFQRPGSSWVTLGRGTVATVIDITEPHGDESTVLISDATAAIEDYPIVTLAERIRLWNSAIENDVWYLDDERQWRRHEDRAMGWPERALT